jgi:hypothetical protein
MNDAPEKRTEQVRQQVRPTVFVALGGTGKEVLLRLRRRIIQADWNRERLHSISEFPVAKFFYFDTDTTEGRESDRAAATDPLYAAVKFAPGETLQKAVDVAKYQRDLRAHPHIEEWLPQRDLSRIDASKGAGQVRAISRLLFFDTYTDFIGGVRRKCQEVADNLGREADLKRLGLDVGSDIRVVVIMSGAGGTGSGAFIDAGYAIKSIKPKVSKLDLFMILPSAFADANAHRVYANGYAALSELEHVMRPNPNPEYAPNGWTGSPHEKPADTKPYDDVYFFDSSNIVRQTTTNRNHLYDMMADVLFEDFGNSEFASRKRSVDSNQTQHKMKLYYPRVPPEMGLRAIAYSKGYSAMGQSTIATTGSLEHEAAVATTGLNMMLAFFGVAQAGGKKNIPTTEERDAFMAEALNLRGSVFQDFPKHSPASSISEYQLVNRLLQREDASMIDGAVTQALTVEFQAIRNNVESFAEWPTKIADVAQRFRRDVDGAVDSGPAAYGPLGNAVQSARARITRAWKATTGDESILDRLYQRLDNYVKGGLDYTTSLVEMITQQLEDGGGVIQKLAAAEKQYDAVANHLIEKAYADSIRRLTQAAEGGMLKKGSRADAEAVLPQVQDDLAAHLKFRLRSIACKEAQILLRETCDYLGRKVAARAGDHQGEPVWTGIVGEFKRHYRLIDQTLDLVRNEVKTIDNQISRRPEGMFRTVQSRSAPKISVTDDQLKLWAQEAFEGFGGCRKLFERISNEEERIGVLNQLRAIAKSKLKHYEAEIPSVVDALRSLSPREQREILSEFMQRAMPWVQADFPPNVITGDNFKALIAVDKAAEFKAEFGSIVDTVRPAARDMASPQIVESGVPGRLVFYCELAGFPLESLVQLRGTWLSSFERELNADDAIPLFNHDDMLRFPVPVPPTQPELERMAENLALFIRGVITGLLRRKPGMAGDYQMLMSKVGAEDWRKVGTERSIRRLLFSVGQKAHLTSALQEFEAGLSPIQILALGELAQWTADRAYARRLVEDAKSRAEDRIGGVGYHLAKSISEEYVRRFEEVGGFSRHGVSIALNDARKALFARIGEWTTIIPGSLNDVEHAEANRDKGDNEALRATDKRQIDPQRFTTEFLLSIAGGPAAGTSAGGGAARTRVLPPLDDEGPASLDGFNVAADGVDRAKIHDAAGLLALIRAGQVKAETKVFHPDVSSKWVRAGEVPAIAKAIAGNVRTLPPLDD